MRDPPTRDDTDVVGPRAAAQLVDLIVIVLAIAAVALVADLFVSAGGVGAAGWINAVGFLLIVLVFLGYGFALETVWDGQTVGKRLLGIRVVMDSGRDLTTGGAFVRNLPAVFAPGWLAYLVALFSMATSDRHQRLFDRVANTVVVRDRSGADDAPVGGIHDR